MDPKKLEKIALVAIRGGTQSERDTARDILKKHGILSPEQYLHFHTSPMPTVDNSRKTPISNNYTSIDFDITSLEKELRDIQDELFSELANKTNSLIESLVYNFSKLFKK